MLTVPNVHVDIYIYIYTCTYTYTDKDTYMSYVGFDNSICPKIFELSKRCYAKSLHLSKSFAICPARDRIGEGRRLNPRKGDGEGVQETQVTELLSAGSSVNRALWTVSVPEHATHKLLNLL